MPHLNFSTQSLKDVLIQLKTINESWVLPYCVFLEQFISGQKIEVKSSGSTGKPKTLIFTADQYKASANKSIAYFNFQKGQVAACALPGNTVGGQLMLVRAFLSQMRLYLCPPKLDAFTNISETVDFAPMVGSQFQQVLDTNTSHTFKKILLGGGPITPHHVEAIEKTNSEVFASYGMTETLSHVALRNLSKKEKYFALLPGNTAKINADGCIQLSCDYLQSPLNTTDLGHIHPNGLEILGRADFTIISSGKKIQPEKIETELQFFLKRDFLVAGKPDPQYGNIIGIFGKFASIRIRNGANKQLQPR